MNKMKDSVIQYIEDHYNDLLCGTSERIAQNIYNQLNASGVMFRIFSRTKDLYSIKDKIAQKYSKYYSENRGLRDLFGIRIVLYFSDDIDICIDILNDLYVLMEKERDNPDPSTFKPQRINYVYKIPETEFVPYSILKKCMIDPVFEVQIRTIFSEGWHEVEHDLRYKYKECWDNYDSYSRELNGIFATLEICNSSILSICDRLAYENYKNNLWESMLRNKFRLRFSHDPLNKEISSVFTSENKIAKQIFRFDRSELIRLFYAFRIPVTYNNAVYLINYKHVHAGSLDSLIPDFIKKKAYGIWVDIDEEL